MCLGINGEKKKKGRKRWTVDPNDVKWLSIDASRLDSHSQYLLITKLILIPHRKKKDLLAFWNVGKRPQSQKWNVD